MNIKSLHQDSDGISPYLRCPWCNYADVCGEFCEYRHPDQLCSVVNTGTTFCGQCLAAGPTAMFLLAYDPAADMGDAEEFREMYLMQLRLAGS